MFIFGAIVGLAIGAIAAVLVNRRQGAQLASMGRTSSSQFRRITALEQELAESKANGAAEVRAEKLRNAREFGQYKTLLRRADSALAQAKIDRRNSAAEALSEAA